MRTALRLQPADPSELLEPWRGLALPMHTYLAACGCRSPSHPVKAIEWLTSKERWTFLVESFGLPVVAIVEPSTHTRTARLLVLSTSGADFDGVEELVRSLLHIAFRDLNVRKCEWPVLACWQRARSAAASLGLVEEVVLPEACAAGGVYHDLILAGQLAHELKPHDAT